MSRNFDYDYKTTIDTENEFYHDMYKLMYRKHRKSNRKEKDKRIKPVYKHENVLPSDVKRAAKKRLHRLNRRTDGYNYHRNHYSLDTIYYVFT